MLDPHYLLTVGDDLANRFFEVETEILIDIAKRIKASNLTMSSTAQYQIMKLQQLGLQTEYINQMLAQLLGVSDQVVAEIMNDSAYESIREDMKIYQEADMLDGRTVDLTEQVKVGTKALQGELSNLCQTTVQTANKRFTDLLDKAYLNVSSGLLSSQQAVDQAVKELAKDGLQMVDYKSGAHRQLDSAVRVAVRTATTKNACACQEQVMDDLDVNLVEVSSHMGARPSHAKWQGKIYWRKKKYGNYKNFEDATRYGHGDGLGGWNCRHQFYPYIPGVSEKTYEPYRLTENKEQYELEQKQRYNERMIREWKRRQQIMESAGLDSTYERSKVREWQKKNKALIEAHSDILKRDYSREKAYLASKNGKIDISGVRITGALDPDSRRASKHADRYYEEIRKRKTDYKKVAKSAGISESEAKRIKNYLFVDEHDLANGKARFDPSYRISESWRRLTEGKNIQPHDLTLLRHEQYENELIQQGMTQDEAHRIASRKYNYAKESDEYYDRIKKNQKK